MNSIKPRAEPLIAFGAFQLDAVRGELRNGDGPVKLAPQPLNVLLLLVRQAGELVTRKEIRQQVWGEDTFVDFEHGLNFCIRQIRAALQDDAAHPLFIETVPKRGYRFIAPVDKIAPAKLQDETETALKALPPQPRRGWAQAARQWRWLVLAGLAVLAVSVQVVHMGHQDSPVGSSVASCRCTVSRMIPSSDILPTQ